MTTLTKSKNDVLNFAREIYHKTNLNIFPCVNKAPIGNWGQFQHARPNWNYLENLFQKHRNAGVGIICGFDNVVALDFDAKYDGTYRSVSPSSDLSKKIIELERGVVTPPLVNLIEILDIFAEFGINPYVERTPSRGYHVIFRTPNPPRKQKVLEYPNGNAAIELQGIGSFVVVAPTPNYIPLNGSLDALPFVKNEILQQILEFCRELSASKSNTYADVFDKVLQVAKEWGFQVAGQSELGVRIKRPGTEKLCSGTIFRNSGKVYLFTTNAPPFEANEIYDPVTFVALAKFDGDKNKAQEWLGVLPEKGKKGKVNFFLEAKEFLLSVGKYRRNIVKGLVELLPFNEQNWRPLGDFDFSEFFVQAREKGILITKENFREVVKALASQNPFNPFENFFESLEYDGKNYIKEFADGIVTEPDVQNLVYPLLLAFFVSATAQALGTRGEDLMVIFIGRQGTGKTSLLRHIVPKLLREYYTEVTGFAVSKDILKASATSFIVNLDDVDSLTSQEIVFLKSLISKDYVDFRDFYGRDWLKHWRYASLCGSGNNPKLFFDPSGYRRFITLPVVEIKKELFDFEIEKLWSEAYYLYKQNGVIRLDEVWIETLNNLNSRFENVPAEVEMVKEVFQFPADDSKTLVWSATKVANFLCSVFPKHRVTTKKVAIALGRAGFRSKHTKNGNLYFLQIKSGYEHFNNIFANFNAEPDEEVAF